MPFAGKVHFDQGGNVLVVESGGTETVKNGGKLIIATGGKITPASGTQAAAIAVPTDLPSALTSITAILTALQGAGIVAPPA